MVHLRSVRLRGFKTFAKPTELTFEPGVTVIIGPNGSGKSNIADAVLWVLGEQSPANLRGRSMQDVIFTGPEGRRSSAVAEVSLVFDNNGSGSLPLEWSELEVTRRLTRDTGSEYRLNGSGCRLLDVQDVVGVMGLGREMHSVVSQGKVEAFLNSTPEARRALVEEAAGLGRFKKRRERAQVKLERTRQNLLRVADVEREVKSALRPLRQQVAAAEKFAQATEEWALAKARLALRSLVDVKESLAKVEEELGGVEARRRQIEARLAELGAQRAAEEESFSAALQEREQLGAVYHQTRAGAEHIEGRAVSLRQRLVRIEGELDRARRRYDLAQSEAGSSAVRLEEVMAATTDETRLARVSGWAESLRRALEESLPAYRAAGATEDDLKDAVFELEAARSRALQDREFLTREAQERGRLNTELATVAAEATTRLEQLEAAATALVSDVEAAEAALLEAGAAVRSAAAGRDEARALAEEAARADAVLGETLAGLESRCAVLNDVLSRREGTPAGARQLLAAGQGGRALAEVLDVEPGYERALAAALGPLAQAVVMPEAYELARAFEASGLLEVVRESAAPSPARPESAPPVGTRDLWDVVSGPEGVVSVLRRLVAPTAVVVDRDRLGGAPPDGGPGARDDWRLVSREGEVFQTGVHAARRQELGAETLLRARNELAEAGIERKEALARREEAKGAAERAIVAASEAESHLRQQEELLRQAERQVAALRGDHDLQSRRLEEAQRQCAELAGRKERESGLVEQMRSELRAVEEGMAAKELELEKARTALREHQAQVEALRRTVGRLEEKKGQAALVEVRLRERCRSHENERARALTQRDAAVVEAAQCRRRVEALERYVPVLTTLLTLAGRLGAKAQETVAILASRVDASRVEAEGASRVMRDWGSMEAQCRRDLDALSARSTELRVDQAVLQDRTRLLEDELAELHRRHLSPRDVAPEDVMGTDPVALEAAVERAERRRERIGPVNPLAEQECAEMEERAGFFEEQRRDLEASLAQLQDVITDLDEHIERVFAEIFTATKENFSAVIASVFPGSKGALKLTEPRRAAVTGEGEDDGEVEQEGGRQAGGITLEVKLPNKSPRSLSLLSGGEKAMTAIAFLFSLFLARPCPFYILDEVEASLDDINIRRFLSLVRKYRERTQFIIITHQRQTMEVADTLYGVTLESDGTSRVLSRRLAVGKGD
ncbi:MAG: chromosome segregation protein SMC [Thermoleophilia bacterium]|nr:chromosome segregation protein SMC [Thermoleophilia bacterium]